MPSQTALPGAGNRPMRGHPCSRRMCSRVRGRRLSKKSRFAKPRFSRSIASALVSVSNSAHDTYRPQSELIGTVANGFSQPRYSPSPRGAGGDPESTARILQGSKMRQVSSSYRSMHEARPRKTKPATSPPRGLEPGGAILDSSCGGHQNRKLKQDLMTGRMAWEFLRQKTSK